MNSNIKQIRAKRYTAVIKLLITIFFWACLVSAILCAVLGIIILLIPDVYSFFLKPNTLGKLPFMMRNEGSAGIGLSAMLEYNGDVNLLSATDMKPVYEMLLFKVAASQAILAAFFYQLVSVLKSVKENIPFAAKNSCRISVMGFLLIAYTIVLSIGEYIMLKLFLATVTISDVSLKFSLNTGGILIGLLLILLAGIFNHGGYLQEEYDTTL